MKNRTTVERKSDREIVVTRTFNAPARIVSSKEALDAAGTGAADAMGETFDQLDEFLVTLGADASVKEPQ